METLVPASWRGQVLLYMVITLWPAMILVDGDSSSCTPAINMARHQIFEKPPGHSLTLKCPIQLCNPELPNVTWCKINGEHCDSVRIGERIYSSMEEHGEDYAIHVLKFDLVQVNDTGYYQCRAVYKEQKIVGSTVQIVITGEFVAENITITNITGTGNRTDLTNFQTFTLFVYIMSSMGGVCVLIITISSVIYCQKQRKVKHRSSPQDPASTEELQFVAVSGSPKKCPQKTQGGASTDTTAVTIEVTYDNAHMGYKSSTHNVCDPEEEDSIVYADLNHNANKTNVHFEDNCEVEYATVSQRVQNL